VGESHIASKFPDYFFEIPSVSQLTRHEEDEEGVQEVKKEVGEMIGKWIKAEE